MSDTTPHPSSMPGNNPDKDFEAIRSEMGEASPPDEADRRARIEYLRSLTGHKKPKKSRLWLKILLGVFVLALIGGAVYWFLLRPSDKKAHDSTSQQAASSHPAEQPERVVTKHYDSTPLNLGFDHPENWKVSDEGTGKLTVASPASKFKAVNGTTDAQVIFTIQTKQPALSGFKNGNGIATRESEKVAYLKPTPNQRAQTYMSFVSFAGSATAGIDTVFVTGDLGYKKDQAVPQVDIIQGDPLVSIMFAKCNGGTCPTDPSTARITIADSSWDESNAMIKAVKALLLSLSIN